MARRVVQECDLTKQEYDPAETVTLIIKRSGKKVGRTYELSAEAASRLEQQLVSGTKLDPNWAFLTPDISSRMDKPAARTLGELEDDDGKFVAQKKEEMKSEGVDLTPPEMEEGQPTILTELEQPSGEDDCLHMNKGPIAVTMRGGKRIIYRICKGCRKSIPEKKKAEREGYFSEKAPKGSQEGYKGGNDE